MKILETHQSKLYFQDYGMKKKIDGVEVFELKSFPTEDGDFAEILHITNGKSDLKADFEPRQINRSLVQSGAVKGWHIHERQDELWYVSPHSQLVLGLWDVRMDSPTHDVRLKIVLGGGKSRVVYIPRGVGHGVTNTTGRDCELWYFTNQKFDAANPDEGRLPWDAAGADFWSPTRD